MFQVSLGFSRYIYKMTAKCLLESYYEVRRLTEATQFCTHPFGIISGGKVSASISTNPERILLHRFRNEEPVDAGRIQRIRVLAGNLRIAADQMQIRNVNSFLNPRALHREGLSNEEMQVVTRIYAERVSMTLSNIATHLKECLTARTFRMALSFLSSNISTEMEQLAAVCELARLLYPTVQQAIQAGRIYDELQEFVNDKLDEVLR